MTSPLFLARARLKRDASLDALAALLVPHDRHARTAAAHRLVWALFADGPERRRDFLWHEEAPGHFLALSARPPENPHGLFELECKEFAPSLAEGDRLMFRLRANPTVSRGVSGTRSKRNDVVMDALRALPHAARAEARSEIIGSAGRAWLAAQGDRHGFVPEADVGCDGYLRRRIPRTNGADAVLATLDFEGVLTVKEPATFAARLGVGFGHGRAFGCGLMLIRRARC
jgi:CRISPR system Cascade subunit CasE